MFDLKEMEDKLPEGLLEAHRHAALALQDCKALELDLRSQITDVLLEGRDTGTHNFELHGLHVKAVKGVSYKLDSELIQEFIDNEELSDFELELLRIKYELKLTDYKSASFPIDVLDQALVVKPSLPTLAIKLGD
jgi:hypothetical protein